MQTELKFILTGRIISKKNKMSQFFNKKTGRMISYYTKEFKDWENEKLEELKSFHPEVIPGRVSWTAKFWLPDRRKTDLSNKNESIQDLLVKQKIIEDDNCGVLEQVHLYYMGVDKEHPRVEITIQSLE